jgi:hypothetical protein
MKTILHIFDMELEEKRAKVDQILEKFKRPELKQYLYTIAPPGGLRPLPVINYQLPFSQDDPTLERLIDALKQAGIQYRPERQYTRQELLQAELLELMVTGVVGEVKDDQYDRSTACRYCGHYRGSSHFVQVADLVIDKRLMGQKDIAATYGYEIVITEHLAQLFQEAGFSGYELRAVYHHSKRLTSEPVLYQLMPTHVLPPMAVPPTRVKPCPVCGKPLHDTYSEIFYHRRDLEQTGLKDFNLAQERWLIAITQRVYRLLLEHKVKKFKVEVIRIMG